MTKSPKNQKFSPLNQMFVVYLLAKFSAGCPKNFLSKSFLGLVWRNSTNICSNFSLLLYAYNLLV